MKRYIKARISDFSDEDYETLREIVKDENTSPDVLAQIANIHNSLHNLPYEELSTNPNTPESALRHLYERNRWLSEYVAKNPNISTELIDEMIDDVISKEHADDELFIQLSYNPKTTARQLKRITDYVLEHPNAGHIMWYLIKNDKFPASALQKLVHHRKFAWMESLMIGFAHNHPNATLAIKSFLEKEYPGYF